MKLKSHIQLLVICSLGWIVFWIAGLPDYFQQYSTQTMIIVDTLILPPLWFLVYKSVRLSRSGNQLRVSLWWTFYFTVPLAIYDYLYCGIYLNHGATFVYDYWYLTVYYILPWLLFPPMGLLLEKKNS